MLKELGTINYESFEGETFKATLNNSEDPEKVR